MAIGFVAACIHPSAEPSVLAVGAAELDALPAEFTLVSWNTHKRDSARFVAEFERFSTDGELLLLQEATSAHLNLPSRSSGADVSRLPDARAWTLVVAFEVGRERQAAGVATGTTVAPTRELAVFSPIREPFTRTAKSALLTWVTLEPLAGPMLLVNLHGINFRLAPALASQLAALDRDLDAHAGPVVVAGDFNTWSPRRREVVAAFVARHGLAPAFTGPDAPRLDAIYTRGLVVRDAQILTSRSSDHDALRVELALP